MFRIRNVSLQAQTRTNYASRTIGYRSRMRTPFPPTPLFRNDLVHYQTSRSFRCTSPRAPSITLPAPALICGSNRPVSFTNTPITQRSLCRKPWITVNFPIQFSDRKERTKDRATRQDRTYTIRFSMEVAIRTPARERYCDIAV